MKAIYVLWPNFEHLDKLIDSGIDTLLVTAHDLPWEQPSGYYDSREITVQTISRYRGHVRIFLVPLWVRPWVDVPEGQRWEMRNGNVLKKTPCPISRAYIRSRTVPAIDFCHEYNLDGIIWDLEHLEQQKPSVVPFYKNFKKPNKRCWCVYCRHYNTEDLWKVHAGLIREVLNESGIPVHGQMPYSSGWTMRQFPGDLHHFSEETYQGDISRWERLKWRCSWKKYKVSPKLIPGVWCEWFINEQVLINYIKHLIHKYGGFWLYSHEFFGQAMPNPHVGYPMKGPASDWFYEGLRKI